MDFIQSHGLMHLQVPQMVPNLIFSYCGLFFILIDPAFACCSLGGVVGALAGEDRGEKVIQHLSLLHVLGDQVSCLLPESV